jgi:hypothetical protein
MYYDEKMTDGVLHCRYTPDGEWRPVAQPVAWCRSSEFNDAQTKRQSFSGWREHHDDCDMALYAAPAPTPTAMTDQPQHRATPEQWETASKWAGGDGFGVMHACLLELRDRIAALEAAQASTREILGNSPARSLVERIEAVAGGDARTAIREVAAWIQDRHDSDQVVHTAYEAAAWLRIEAANG